IDNAILTFFLPGALRSRANESRRRRAGCAQSTRNAARATRQAVPQNEPARLPHFAAGGNPHCSPLPPREGLGVRGTRSGPAPLPLSRREGGEWRLIVATGGNSRSMPTPVQHQDFLNRRNPLHGFV